MNISNIKAKLDLSFFRQKNTNKLDIEDIRTDCHFNWDSNEFDLCISIQNENTGTYDYIFIEIEELEELKKLSELVINKLFKHSNAHQKSQFIATLIQKKIKE